MRKLMVAMFLVVCACSPVQPQTSARVEGLVEGGRFVLSAAQAPDRDGATPPGLDRDGATPPGLADGGSPGMAEPLTALPTFGFRPGVEPTGSDYIALMQGVLVTEAAWDSANCGPVPTSGVCVQITMRNMYTTRVSMPHAEFLRLTPTSPTITVTFDSNAMSNPALGTSDAIGLLRYPNLSPAGDPGDREMLYWVFRSPDPPPARFTFSVVAKGRLN